MKDCSESILFFCIRPKLKYKTVKKKKSLAYFPGGGGGEGGCGMFTLQMFYADSVSGYNPFENHIS